MNHHCQRSKPKSGKNKSEQTHQRDRKTLGVAKSTIWYIKKKKKYCTAELSNTKKPRRPQKATGEDDRNIIFLVKKNCFNDIWPVQEDLPGGRYIFVTKSTIKRSQSKREGLTTSETIDKPQKQRDRSSNTSENLFIVLEQNSSYR